MKKSVTITQKELEDILLDCASDVTCETIDDKMLLLMFAMLQAVITDKVITRIFGE